MGHGGEPLAIAVNQLAAEQREQIAAARQPCAATRAGAASRSPASWARAMPDSMSRRTSSGTSRPLCDLRARIDRLARRLRVVGGCAVEDRAFELLAHGRRRHDRARPAAA